MPPHVYTFTHCRRHADRQTYITSLAWAITLSNRQIFNSIFEENVVHRLFIHTILGYCSIIDYSKYMHTDRQHWAITINADTNIDMQN